MPLRGDLTIAHAETHRRNLCEALASGAAVALRFEDVNDVDLAFIQLLCAAHRSFVAAVKSLTIEGEIPAPLRKALTDAGITACSCGAADMNCLWKPEGV